MKSILSLFVSLFILPQVSFATKNVRNVETSTHRYSIVETNGFCPLFQALNKNTAQVETFELDRKTPLALTLDGKSLYIYVSPSSIYRLDLETNKVDETPFVFDPLINDCVILDDLAFAVRHNELCVIDLTTKNEPISVTIKSVSPKISIKDDVIFLNGKVLNVEHLLKNFTIEDIKEDSIPEAITATASSSSSTSSSSVPPAAPSSTVAEPKSTTEKKTQKLDKKAKKIAKMLKAAQGDKSLSQEESEARVKKLEKRLKKTQQKAKKVQKNS